MSYCKDLVEIPLSEESYDKVERIWDLPEERMTFPRCVNFYQPKGDKLRAQDSKRKTTLEASREITTGVFLFQ